MKEINLTRYIQKQRYLEEKEKATKKVFTKPPDLTRKPKAIDLTINIGKFKCKKK